MEIDLTNVGSKLKSIRENSKLTQSQIAEFLNIDQSLVSKIEKGERSISSDMLEKLATLFCYSIFDIVSKDTVEKKIDISFRTNLIENSDLIKLATINRIVLNQFEMDKFFEGDIND